MLNQIRTAFESYKRGEGSKQLLTFFKHCNLYQYIIDNTNYMGNDLNKYNFRHRLYMILNGYTDFPKCVKCGNPNNRQSIWFDNTYEDKDNSLCYHCNDLKRAETIKNTVIKEYGVTNISQLDFVKSKKTDTNMKNRGVPNPSMDPEIQKLKEKTSIEHWGYSSYLSSPYAIEKNKQIIFNEYGVDNVSKSQVIKDKKIETSRKKNGTDYWNQTDKARAEISARMKLLSEQIIASGKITSKNRYGCEHWLHNEEKHNEFLLNNRKRVYKRILDNDKLIPLFDFDFLNQNYNNVLKWKCKKCNFEFEDYRNVIYRNIGYCPNCNPKPLSGTSKEESEVFEFIKSFYNGKIIRNTKKIIAPYELDFYLEDLSIAFEFDGGYWHSQKYKDSDYHLMKTNECASKQIQLYHIFESDWNVNKNVIKTRIKNILGYFDFCITDSEKLMIYETADESVTTYHIMYDDKEICNYHSIVTCNTCNILDRYDYLSSDIDTNMYLFKYLKEIKNFDIIGWFERISWPLWKNAKNCGFIINSVLDPMPWQLIRDNRVIKFEDCKDCEVFYDCGQINYLWMKK